MCLGGAGAVGYMQLVLNSAAWGAKQLQTQLSSLSRALEGKAALFSSETPKMLQTARLAFRGACVTIAEEGLELKIFSAHDCVK